MKNLWISINKISNLKKNQTNKKNFKIDKSVKIHNFQKKQILRNFHHTSRKTSRNFYTQFSSQKLLGNQSSYKKVIE